MSGEGPTVLVAGVGNIFLGDDGFGCEVVRCLLARPQRRATSVAIHDFGIRGFDLAHALANGPRAAILIDAAPRGEPPGTVTVIEAAIPIAPGADDDPEALIDTHGMDPVRVLRLARVLGGVPERVLVVGLEPAPIDPDPEAEPSADWVGLSESATAAIGPAIEIVERLANDLVFEMAEQQKGVHDGPDRGMDRPASTAAIAESARDARDGDGGRARDRRPARCGDGRPVTAGDPPLSPPEADVMATGRA